MRNSFKNLQTQANLAIFTEDADASHLGEALLRPLACAGEEPQQFEMWHLDPVLQPLLS